MAIPPQQRLFTDVEGDAHALVGAVIVGWAEFEKVVSLGISHIDMRDRAGSHGRDWLSARVDPDKLRDFTARRQALRRAFIRHGPARIEKKLDAQYRLGMAAKEARHLFAHSGIRTELPDGPEGTTFTSDDIVFATSLGRRDDFAMWSRTGAQLKLLVLCLWQATGEIRGLTGDVMANMPPPMSMLDRHLAEQEMLTAVTGETPQP